MLKLPLDSSIFSKCGIKVAGALKDCLYVGELTLKKLLNDQFTPLIHVCKHRRWLVIPLWAGLECSCRAGGGCLEACRKGNSGGGTGKAGLLFGTKPLCCDRFVTMKKDQSPPSPHLPPPHPTSLPLPSQLQVSCASLGMFRLVLLCSTQTICCISCCSGPRPGSTKSSHSVTCASMSPLTLKPFILVQFVLQFVNQAHQSSLLITQASSQSSGYLVR